MTTARASRTPLLWLSLTALLAASAAGAQTVYRCGTNQYSQLPCENGKAIDVADRRSAEQLGEARKAIADQHRLGSQMARERQMAEQAFRPALAGGIGLAPAKPEPPETSAKPEPRTRKKAQKSSLKTSQAGNFEAIAPGSVKPKKKKTQL